MTVPTIPNNNSTTARSTWNCDPLLQGISAVLKELFLALTVLAFVATAIAFPAMLHFPIAASIGVLALSSLAFSFPLLLAAAPAASSSFRTASRLIPFAVGALILTTVWYPLIGHHSGEIFDHVFFQALTIIQDTACPLPIYGPQA